MPRIFDNLSSDGRLLTSLRTTMAGAASADFCIGYFNLRGWSGLAAGVGQLCTERQPACRVLVGMQRPAEDEVRQSFRFTSEPEQPDQQAILRLKRTMAEEFRTQLTIGAPTNQDEAALRQLADQIRQGLVSIKLFLRHPLHAKLYLVHRSDPVAPVIGYVGSSNLTYAGLSKQGELNVDVVESDAALKLQAWFDDRWQDIRCLDISDELLRIITEESWARDALIPPYHVYLKMVYHLSQEARAGLAEFTIPPDLAGELFEFQKAAVKIAAHHLNKRGGVLIGDVVGLGKTLMATALARVLQEDQRFDTLIICPPNLEPMWQSYVDKYGLLARVLPSSRFINARSSLRRYRVVLIDESHNFRNTEGRIYRAIRDYIQANDSRVILLSATPYNKDYTDLSAQLRLFIPPNQDLGIRPEALFRQTSEADFIARHQSGPRTLLAFEQSEHADDWRNLMRRFLVRRTRGFIQENYASRDENGRTYLPMPGGGRFYFPVRVPKTITFAFDEASGDAYPRLFAPNVVEAINHLRLPRYGLGLYVVKRPRRPASAAEQRELDSLGRAGIRLKGFSRTNLFKRLESGGPAFLQSIERHILRNFVFLHALEHDLPLPIGTQNVGDFDSRFTDDDAEQVEAAESGGDAGVSPIAQPPSLDEAHYARLAEQVYAHFRSQGGRQFKWLRADLFDPDLARDLLADARALLQVLAHCGRWDPAADAKLLALARLIQEEHPAEKILVFTQFADTVSYLTEQMQRLGVTDLAGVTADSPNPTRLAWRFSPRSNGKEDLAQRDGELRVLIATDVLSEGQNLQDAAIVVNYDLPWAIIRLIQRAGRVDRIGQQSREIRCYSFVPAAGLEEIIKLRARIRNRLHQNAEVVGADEAFFEDDVEAQPLVDLYNEKAGILDEGTGDELGVDPTSEAYQIWKNAIDADPRLQRVIEQLPNSVYATKAHEVSAAAPAGALIFIRASDGNDALGWVNEQREVVTESPLDVLRAADCLPNTPALPRSEAHHKLVEDGVRHMLKEQSRAGGNLGRPSGARRRVYDRLDAYARSLERGPLSLFAPSLDDVKRVMQDIHDHPLKSGATDSINRLLRSGAPDDELARQVIELRNRDELSAPTGTATAAEPQIICSMGLAPR